MRLKRWMRQKLVVKSQQSDNKTSQVKKTTPFFLKFAKYAILCILFWRMYGLSHSNLLSTSTLLLIRTLRKPIYLGPYNIHSFSCNQNSGCYVNPLSFYSQFFWTLNKISCFSCCFDGFIRCHVQYLRVKLKKVNGLRLRA